MDWSNLPRPSLQPMWTSFLRLAPPSCAPTSHVSSFPGSTHLPSCREQAAINCLLPDLPPSRSKREESLILSLAMTHFLLEDDDPTFSLTPLAQSWHRGNGRARNGLLILPLLVVWCPSTYSPRMRYTKIRIRRSRHAKAPLMLCMGVDRCGSRVLLCTCVL